MSPTVGVKLGSDEILAPIGKGGMGEVYRPRGRPLARCHDQGQQRSVLPSASRASRIAYTGRAEGGLTQWYAPPGSAWFHASSGYRAAGSPALDQGAKTPITILTSWEATPKL